MTCRGGACPGPPEVYYPYMASIVGKKRGNATYYYLVESARVDGKPRIVSQEYLGTAEELAAAMRGGGLGLPDRTGHKDFGAVAAARVTKIPAPALDHRRFWDAMHAVTLKQLEKISQTIAVRIVQSSGVDVS